MLVTPAIQALILGPGPSTPFRCAMRALLLFFEETYRSVFKFEYPPLHDPCAVAYALAPHIFEVGLAVCRGEGLAVGAILNHRLWLRSNHRHSTYGPQACVCPARRRAHRVITIPQTSLSACRPT